MLQVHGLCLSHLGPQQDSRLLLSAWPSLSLCKHLGNEPVTDLLSLLSLFATNKWNISWDKWQKAFLDPSICPFLTLNITSALQRSGSTYSEYTLLRCTACCSLWNPHMYLHPLALLAWSLSNQLGSQSTFPSPRSQTSWVHPLCWVEFVLHT